MTSIPAMDTPPKISKPEAGYQTRGVRTLPGVPAMSSEQVTNPKHGGAADVSRTPVGGTVFDDAD